MKNTIKIIFKYTIHPILLLSYMCLMHLAYGQLPDIILLLSLLFINLVVLWTLEKIMPYRNDWKMNYKELKENSFYFLSGALADNIGKFIAIVLAMRLTSGSVDLEIYLSTPLAVITLEFFAYWIHRLTHSGGFLWKVHVIHHTPSKIFTWNNNKMHPFNIILLKTARLLPLIAIGFSAETILLASVFGLIQNYISHANVDIRSGFLSYVIGTPELHRLHHSQDMSEAKNYSAVIPYWDLLFGTYIRNTAVESIGVVAREKYPNSILEEMLYPFK